MSHQLFKRDLYFTPMKGKLVHTNMALDKYDLIMHHNQPECKKAIVIMPWCSDKRYAL